MRRTLLKCGWLVTMDETLGDLADAELLIVGDRIAAIGRRLSADHDEEIDAHEMIVAPGLVNAHIHVWQGALRAIGSEWVGEDYFRIVPPRIAPHYGPEDNYLANLLGALAQIDGGVTTMGDYCHNLNSTEQAERSIDALEESGARAVFYYGGGRGPAPMGEAARDATRDAVRAVRLGRLADDDARVTLGLAMPGPEYVDWRTTLADFRFARELAIVSSTHSSRPRAEQTTPDGYLRLAAEGLIGADHNVVHGNFLSDRELAALVDAGVAFTATVMVEYRGRMSDPIVNRVRALGAQPALGTDNEMIASGCLLREMQSALLTARNAAHRANAARGAPPLRTIPVPSREALAWATIGGAKALGLDKVTGSLTPGKKADLILLRANDANLFPLRDPIFGIVEQAHAGNVDSVMIDGVWRKRDGRALFPPATLAAKRAQLREAGARLLHEAGYPAPRAA